MDIATCGPLLNRSLGKADWTIDRRLRQAHRGLAAHQVQGILVVGAEAHMIPRRRYSVGVASQVASGSISSSETRPWATPWTRPIQHSLAGLLATDGHQRERTTCRKQQFVETCDAHARLFRQSLVAPFSVVDECLMPVRPHVADVADVKTLESVEPDPIGSTSPKRLFQLSVFTLPFNECPRLARGMLTFLATHATHATLHSFLHRFARGGKPPRAKRGRKVTREIASCSWKREPPRGKPVASQTRGTIDLILYAIGLENRLVLVFAMPPCSCSPGTPLAPHGVAQAQTPGLFALPVLAANVPAAGDAGVMSRIRRMRHRVGRSGPTAQRRAYGNGNYAAAGQNHWKPSAGPPGYGLHRAPVA